MKLAHKVRVFLWKIRTLNQTPSIVLEYGPFPIRLRTKASGVTGLMRLTGGLTLLWMVSLNKKESS